MSNGVKQQYDLTQIQGAIHAIHDPKSTNAIRQAATKYLEEAKAAPNAPELGYSLALDPSQDAMLRHYGLQVLEYYIKYKWDGDEQEEQVLRNYTLQLAQSMQAKDPPFVKNKVAQIWTEIAKRSWGVQWTDMDELLHKLWGSSYAGKVLVLSVLEGLSEEIFVKEDATTAIRGEDLADACTEIFTSSTILAQRAAVRQNGAPLLRYSDEGWLGHFCQYLSGFFDLGSNTDPEALDIAQRTMRVVRSLMNWISPATILQTGCFAVEFNGLVFDDEDIRTNSIDSINTFLHRAHVEEEETYQLVSSMFSPPSVGTLAQILGWAADIEPTDIDSTKYAFLLKLGELFARIGGYISEVKPQIDNKKLPDTIPEILRQMWILTSHPSLMASRTMMTVWGHIIHSDLTDDPSFQPYIPLLLEHCTSRLVRFEAFTSEDSSEPLLLFLDEDFDTLPEKHAFLGNYRRYCFDILEVIVQKLPLEAGTHVLDRSRAELGRLAGDVPQTPATFSRHAPSVVMIESQLAVVDAAAKGYYRWNDINKSKESSEAERIRTVSQGLFRQWCESAFTLRFKDPEVVRRFIPVAINIGTKVLRRHLDFAVSMAQEILTNTNLVDDPNHLEYSEAVRTAHYTCTIELQRLALTFADAFLAHYGDFEQTIQRALINGKVGSRPQTGYQAFLLIIVQRSTNIDSEQRLTKMRQLLEPVKAGWSDAEVANAAESFQSFCTFLGFAPLPDYFINHRFNSIEDWSAQQLDQQGKDIQDGITVQSDKLPIRMTRGMLAATTEKADQSSPAMEAARTIWGELMPVILPNILKFISQAQNFYNPSNWSNFPVEVQQVMKRVFADRFWQAGISAESRDDFFNKVNNKSSYDGLASTVRGSPRQVRETCYAILDSFSKFREYFFSIPDLPEPLAEALFGNALSLSPHHYNVLLRHAEGLISRCPVTLRNSFLPPLLSTLYRQSTTKLSDEWATAIARREEAGNEDDLGDEMKLESILRQVTGFACALTAGLLDQTRPNPTVASINCNSAHPHSKFADFIVSRPDILGPILLFAKAALSFRDTRSCGAIIRTLRGIIPQFGDPSEVHTFICTEILQAAIISLNNPYFVDVQRDLASLIAQIITLDTENASTIIVQLPGMTTQADRTQAILQKIRSSEKDKLARGWVLELLKEVRGVSIHELGKMERPSAHLLLNKTAKAKMAMTVDEGIEIKRGGSPTLEGIADMFGGGSG